MTAASLPRAGEIALLPCAHCGSPAEEQHNNGPTGERYRWIQCTHCGAMSECCDEGARGNNPDEPDPAALWNARAPRIVTPEEVEKAAEEIDPMAFKSWLSMYDYCIRSGDDDAAARMYADKTYGPSIERARVAVRAVIASLGLGIGEAWR